MGDRVTRVWSCADHPRRKRGCGSCQAIKRAHYANRHRRAVKPRTRPRTDAEQARIEAKVRHLKGLDTYALARLCESILARHIDGIEVRPPAESERAA